MVQLCLVFANMLLLAPRRKCCNAAHVKTRISGGPVLQEDMLVDFRDTGKDTGG